MPTYKDKKNSTWYCKFYYCNWTGKRKQHLKRGFRTQKSAKAYERDFLSKTHVSPDIKFSALVELYMEDCRSRLKPTTVQNKEYIINDKVLPYFGEMQLNKIEPATVRRWQNELLTHKNGYTLTYLKTVHNQLSAIFNYAMKYYKLPSNPARVTGAMGKKYTDSIQFWTKDEFDTFIVQMNDKPLASTIFKILFWTGIRIGELLALTLDDFDFVSQTVRINKNYARHNGQDLLLTPKTPKSNRIIMIPAFLCEAVQDYSKIRYDYRPKDRLFLSNKNTLRNDMKRGCEASGIKRIRVHDLRHSHASLLIEMGFSPLLISERLGHDRIETTLQTYSHLYPNKHSEVADKLQKLAIETTEIHRKIEE